jgi:hypothetical protein
VLLTVAAVIGALGVGAVATAGTYARWNSRAPLAAATVAAGTAALTVTSVSAFPTTALYPGATNRGAFTVANTGDVPLLLGVASLAGPATPTTFSQAITVSVGVDTAAHCASGAFTVTWSGTFAAAVPGAIGSVAVPAHGSTVVCLAEALSASVATGAQGQAASGIVLTIRGTQP